MVTIGNKLENYFLKSLKSL